MRRPDPKYGMTDHLPQSATYSLALHGAGHLPGSSRLGRPACRSRRRSRVFRMSSRSRWSLAQSGLLRREGHLGQLWDGIISAEPELPCGRLWDPSGLRRELRDFAALP